MSRRDFPDPTVDRSRSAHESKPQVVVESCSVNPRISGGRGPNSLDFGPEVKSSRIGHPVVQRLLADAIAREHEPPLGTVPDRERKHAPQLGDALETAFGVEGQKDLRIARPAELDTVRLQRRAQLEIVV